MSFSSIARFGAVVLVLAGVLGCCLFAYSTLYNDELGISLDWRSVNLLLADLQNDPFQGDAIQDAPFESLTYGIQAFLWWDDNDAGRVLDQIKMMGFNTVKQTFAWSSVEPFAGVWDFGHADRIVRMIEERDMHLIVRLGQVPAWAISGMEANSQDDETTDAPPDDLALWGNYCARMASQYKGRVRAYQIWNEPNLRREWGNQQPDAAEYTELLRVCSEAIRPIDPDAILISAGLAPTGNNDAIAIRDDIYLDAMYRAGFQQYVDVVGAHAPGFAPPTYGPDDAASDGRGRWATFRRVEDLRKIMIRHGDAARQMAIMEFGWTIDPVNPDYSWYAVTEAQQAEYIVQAYDYALENWSPWVGLMSLIYISKPSWTEANEEYWWAISLPNNRHREAFYAIASMPKICGDFRLPYRPPDHPEFAGDEPFRICP